MMPLRLPSEHRSGRAAPARTRTEAASDVQRAPTREMPRELTGGPTPSSFRVGRGRLDSSFRRMCPSVRILRLVCP